MLKLEGQFLHQKDSKLHTSQPVEHEQARHKRKGEKISQKPADKLVNFMEVLEQTHLGHRDDPQVLERLKNHYHQELVIDEQDIPQSYYDNQARLLREQGHGDIEVSDEMKAQLNEVIREDQQTTLDKWLDYFMSEDSNSYPMWSKYWAFTNMTKLATYDKEKHAFAKRDKHTVAPYPDLNREALAYVIDAVIKKVGQENIPDDIDPEFQKLLQGANFAKLYAHAIEKITPTEESELANTKGEWIKYDQNSDHMPLVESLQGHGTGWCTAGEATAETQLQTGDFYVYYSYNKDGQPTIPRAAIRMQGNQIAEVRGVASEQNLDPYIGEVVDDKLADFGTEGERYQKKSQDMKRLTDIDNRHQAGQELTKEDLRFLYEIDSAIEGFGYQTDPRIKEILNTRQDLRTDLSLATGYSPLHISLTEEEALQGNIKLHYGDLRLKHQYGSSLKLPQQIIGNLDCPDLYSSEGLRLPERIKGRFTIPCLKSAKDLKLPEHVGGALDLSNLTSAEGLELPEHVGGALDLCLLKSAKDLKLPEHVGGSLHFDKLKSAKDLKLPEHVGGDVDFRNLESAKDLKLPEHVGGNLHFGQLRSAKDLKLPEHVGGRLYLGWLASAEGLKFPKSIGGDLHLRSLTSTKGLELPNIIGGKVYVNYFLIRTLAERYPNLDFDD